MLIGWNRRQWPWSKGKRRMKVREALTCGYPLTLMPKGERREAWWKGEHELLHECYHQWQLNDHCRSPAGINDNLINNLPLCYWWQHSFINLCSPFHHASLLSLFGINGKGYLISTASFIFSFLLLSSESLSFYSTVSHIPCSPVIMLPLYLLRAKGTPPDVFILSSLERELSPTSV